MRQNKENKSLTKKDIITSYLKYILILLFNPFASNTIFNYVQRTHHEFKKTNLKEPNTLAEKVLYLKYHYKTPLLTLCSDKLEMRKYVEIHGLSHYLPEVYYIIKSKKDLNHSYNINKPFIIKGSNRSGGSILVRDVRNIKNNILNSYIKFMLFSKYYYYGREWGYKNNINKVFFEELIGSENDKPIDYKFYCFSGKPEYFMISYGEFEGDVKNHKFDIDCNSIDYKFKKLSKLNANDITISNLYKDMLDVSTVLCKPFPHVRIDFLVIKNRFYIGEMTFYSSSGFIKVLTEYEKEIGSLINLEPYKSDLY